MDILSTTTVNHSLLHTEKCGILTVLKSSLGHGTINCTPTYSLALVTVKKSYKVNEKTSASYNELLSIGTVVRMCYIKKVK